MTSKELAEQVVSDCCDNDLSNTNDYSNPANALKDLSVIILHRLEDYRIVRGDVF